MSITNYTELTNAITRAIARDDMAANIPDWITSFEAVANRRLRTRQMDASAILVPTEGWALLPTDYLAWKEVTFASGPTFPPLEYVTPTALDAMFPDAPQGIARVFTIYGRQLGTAPFDDSRSIWLDYVQKITALEDGANWLLTEHPDAYLFGSLYHAYDFMLDLQNAAFRKSQRDEILDEIQMLSNKSRGVGGMRIIGPTP